MVFSSLLPFQFYAPLFEMQHCFSRVRSRRKAFLGALTPIKWMSLSPYSIFKSFRIYMKGYILTLFPYPFMFISLFRLCLINSPKIFYISGEELDIVDHIYLGQWISMEDTIREIECCINCGWLAFDKLSIIVKNNFPLYLKRKVFDHSVLPALTYIGETWTLTSQSI